MWLVKDKPKNILITDKILIKNGFNPNPFRLYLDKLYDEEFVEFYNNTLYHYRLSFDEEECKEDCLLVSKYKCRTLKDLKLAFKKIGIKKDVVG